MNSYKRFCLPVLFFILAFPCIPLKASEVYTDISNFFYSASISRSATEFGFSTINSPLKEANLFAAAFRGNINSKTSVKLVVPYFAVRADDRLSFGFGDFIFNSTTRVKSDSLAENGLFFRADFRFPTGSKSLYPYSIQSFDGGAGIEVRKRLSNLYLKGAATYTFVGEREHEGDYPYSNHLILGASAGIKTGKRFRLKFSGYNINYRKNGEHWIFIMKIERCMTESISISIRGGFEAGENDEKIFDSMLSLYLTFLFPTGNSNTEK
ncbi:MAG TPA: hypothetical protein VKO43_05520 [Candidatus Krumholzibacteriaceae bacterium]|nr:hypothetical protein [Candidatus Krumholzibacteriaceae bacterium]